MRPRDPAPPSLPDAARTGTTVVEAPSLLDVLDQDDDEDEDEEDLGPAENSPWGGLQSGSLHSSAEPEPAPTPKPEPPPEPAPLRRITISGVVADGEIAHQIVRVGRYRTRTDARGRFSLTAFVRDGFEVRADGHSAGDRSTRRIALRPHQDHYRVTIRLRLSCRF